MKILIVNGYSKASAGIQFFSEFQYFIKKVLKEQKDAETEYFIRDKENLDDFLYELDSSYIKKDAAKLFDYLDMIFITGDSNLLPWHQSANKILILLRMCLRVKKFLFASSFAMQCLIFLSASNLEKNVNIINGQGKGGKIGDFKSLDKEIKDLKACDYFLDNITGDLYSYSYENEEWVAKTNIGLHYHKAAQEFHSIGKFIVQAPVYRPKSLNDNNRNIYVSRNTEIIGYLKKLHLHHWAVQGMSVEFLIPFKNSWYVHPFAFMCKSKKFDIVAECEKGPIVIQFKNILATQFEIDPKYPETSIPLRNFIIYHLRMIKTDNKSSEGLILTYYNPKSDLDLYHDIPNHSKSVRQFKRTFKLFDEKEEKRSKYTHAGMAMKGHGNSFIVEQNAVNDKAFKMKKKTSPEREKVEKNSEKSKKTRLFSHYTTKNTEKNHFFDDNEKNYHMLQDLGIEKFMKTENMENVFKKSDVRSLLHPNINKELFTNEDLWVPGQYTEFKRLYENRKVIRIKSANFTSFAQNTIKRNLFTAKHNTMNKELFYPMSPINPKTPFVEFERQKLIEEKKKNEKSIGPKFILKKPSKLVQLDFLFEDDRMYAPISNHKFRNESKEKWVSHAFKY